MTTMTVKVTANGLSAALLSEVHAGLMQAAGAGGITHIETTDAAGNVSEWIIDSGSHTSQVDMHEIVPDDDEINATIEYHLKARP